MDLATQILGLTLIVIGLVGLFIAIGFMLYPLFLDYREQYFGKRQSGPATGSQSGENT